MVYRLNQAVVRTSDHELHGVASYRPNKCPDQDWLHLVGTQRSLEAPLTAPAAGAAALWKHHACNSPMHQKEQHESNIWFQQSLLGGHQLKPEQCGERGGCQGQSEPLVLKGTDHVASAAVPITELSA